jgi:hypothetical protein
MCEHKNIYFIRKEKMVFEKGEDGIYRFLDAEDVTNDGFVYEPPEFYCVDCGERVEDEKIEIE